MRSPKRRNSAHSLSRQHDPTSLATHYHAQLCHKTTEKKAMRAFYCRGAGWTPACIAFTPDLLPFHALYHHPGNHELGRGRGGLGAVYNPGQGHQGEWLCGAHPAGKGLAWRGRRGRRKGGEGGAARSRRARKGNDKSLRQLFATHALSFFPRKGSVHAQDSRLWGAVGHAEHASGTCVWCFAPFSIPIPDGSSSSHHHTHSCGARSMSPP